MLIVDFDLARRLEGIETWVATRSTRVRLSVRPEDTALAEVAGGVACFLGVGSPLSEARGMGMNGPVSAEDLDAMEQVFFDRGVAAKVNVCPLADASVLEGLAARGYRAVGFEDVLYRELDGSEAFPGPPDGVSLGPVDSAEDLVVCGDVMARGFTAPEEPSAEMREIFATTSQVEGISGLVGRVGGEPAGAACLLVRDGVAMLCGAATLPKFRNRGVQTALMHARLVRAAAAGCGVVQFGALPGSGSHRNAERLGFRVAYTKLMLLRDPS